MPSPVLRNAGTNEIARYQIWTDALCFRQMAKQAPNRYLASMCTRNAVLSAWITLEMSCLDALASGERLPKRTFKEGMDVALDRIMKPRLNFASGVWQEVLAVLKTRNGYAHSGVLSDRFPPLSDSQTAMSVTRRGIKDIYEHMGKVAPPWVDHDESDGWPPVSQCGFPSVIQGRPAVAGEEPEPIKITLLRVSGEEEPTHYLRPDTPASEVLKRVEELLTHMAGPFKAIRVYRGPEMEQVDFEVRE